MATSLSSTSIRLPKHHTLDAQTLADIETAQKEYAEGKTIQMDDDENLADLLKRIAKE